MKQNRGMDTRTLSVAPFVAISCHPVARRAAMYRRHLELVELRERVMSARTRASRARRLAARTPHCAAPFEGVASSLETKATEAEEQARSIEGRLGSEPRLKA